MMSILTYMSLLSIAVVNVSFGMCHPESDCAYIDSARVESIYAQSLSGWHIPGASTYYGRRASIRDLGMIELREKVNNTLKNETMRPLLLSSTGTEWDDENLRGDIQLGVVASELDSAPQTTKLQVRVLQN